MVVELHEEEVHGQELVIEVLEHCVGISGDARAAGRKVDVLSIAHEMTSVYRGIALDLRWNEGRRIDDESFREA